MRSVNLIPKRIIQLADWGTCLNGSFPSVWFGHSKVLAQYEGHSEDAINKLVVEDGNDHVIVLDRPTTIREYEEGEIRAIVKFVKDPKQFLAVDYTDEGLLKRVLRLLLQHEGDRSVLVEGEDGELVPLEDFLGTR